MSDPASNMERVAVTMRALIPRINRVLWKSREMLKATRVDVLRNEVGDYYLFDFRQYCITATHVEPEEFGRKLGGLHPWEEVAL